MIYNKVLDLIGNILILKVNNLIKDENIVDIYVKLEKYNLGGSVKDRVVFGMIEIVEKEGILKLGLIIVELISGNIGIVFVFIGKIKGYKVIIVMLEIMSKERRDLIKVYGVEFVLIEGLKGMKGVIEKVVEIGSGEGFFIL